MATEPTSLLQVTGCPDCALPAEVVARHVLASTDGPVEHARVRCVGGHVFNLPVAMLRQCDADVSLDAPRATPRPSLRPGG